MKRYISIMTAVSMWFATLPATAQEVINTYINSISQATIVSQATQELEVQQDSIGILQSQLTGLQNKIVSDSIQRAQEERNADIWKKSAPVILGYNWQSLTDNSNILTPKYKSSVAINLSTRRTFYLHKKALGSMAKFGLDLTWMDMSMAMYAKGKGIIGSIKDAIGGVTGNTASGTFDNFDDYFNTAKDNAISNYNDDDEFDFSSIDVGKMQLSVGILGIGPSIRLAPFYPLNKPALDKIRLTLYFHYQPTFTLVAFTGDETFVNGGYVGMWRYGANLAYGRFGIGIEHSWAKNNKLSTMFSDEDDDHSGKRNFNFSSTRLYIAFKL